MQRKSVTLCKFASGKTLNDENFATIAEERITKVENGKRELALDDLTTSKLRGIYGLIMNISTRINEPADFEACKPDLQYLKVRMAYEAGRDPSVKGFLDKTLLMKLIDFVKDYDQFSLYCRYAESLVAYFKFYGGKE